MIVHRLFIAMFILIHFWCFLSGCTLSVRRLKPLEPETELTIEPRIFLDVSQLTLHERIFGKYEDTIIGDVSKEGARFFKEEIQKTLQKNNNFRIVNDIESAEYIVVFKKKSVSPNWGVGCLQLSGFSWFIIPGILPSKEIMMGRLSRAQDMREIVKLESSYKSIVITHITLLPFALVQVLLLLDEHDYYERLAKDIGGQLINFFKNNLENGYKIRNDDTEPLLGADLQKRRPLKQAVP